MCLNLPEFTLFYLNLPEFTWVYLSLPEFTKNYLNLSEFTQIYLNLPEFTSIYLNIPELTWTYLNYLNTPKFTWIEGYEDMRASWRDARPLTGRPEGILIRSDGVIHSGTIQILGKSFEIGTVYHSRTLYIKKTDIFSD